MKGLDQTIFKQMKFSDLLEEIYCNQVAKKNQIKILVEELQQLIEDADDAVKIVPLLKEYLEIGVKNDDHLLKMATIIQRITGSNSTSNSDTQLTDAEKEQIMNALKDTKDESKDSKDK